MRLQHTPENQKQQTNNTMNTQEQRICNAIVKELNKSILLSQKEVLTTDEVAEYMGATKSHIYKLTMKGEIPHYKPNGKVCYFNRKEIESWLQRNRIKTDIEIAEQATSYCMKGGARCAR
jgi:excisionase family DNA binding protein